MELLRRVIGIAAGILVAMGFVLVGDYLAALVSPHISMEVSQSPEDMARYMDTLPILAFLAMLVGYAAGAFLGGLITTFISGRSLVRPAMIVGIVLTVGNIFNQMQIPHPLWFSIVSTLMYIPLAWSGWRVIRRAEAPAA